MHARRAGSERSAARSSACWRWQSWPAAGPRTAANAPDLQVGFEAGYRVSWPTLAGEAPPGIVMPNRQKWSGDHAGYDPAITAGVLVANRPIGDRTPRLVDIAPTVLKHFGVPLPASLEGTPLF